MPHGLVGVEIEASQTRTARELWEQAHQVVPNSSCPDPVPHFRHDVEARASANVQEMKTAGEVREQARRVVPNSSCPNPVSHVRFQVGVDVDNATRNDALTEQKLDDFGACRCHGELTLFPPTFLSPCSPLKTVVHRPLHEEIVRRGTFCIRYQQQGWPLPLASLIT